ncbi:MAG TPA: Gfo/Idh/MocA family oxidoreductase [Phenylobacterium sp.]|uniref:Gfo/Idh/MocA family protein n=1 Tax=Phenylobacterium sp. TaxID=1871053 RepID=UPI002C21F4BE|nr:Gfo/Idh/MocA family oxidoreductase [Phenylobacterium sp.]HXA37972.1 Gfo/Idh/MocA family oxidoreductase [Phenylobacterium sp.]
MRLAVVGAGRMARRRLEALAATGGVAVCGVAARRRSSAEALASDFGGAPAFDDYRELAVTRPQAVLVETPHHVQDEIALWAVDHGWHLLLGGPLALTSGAGRRLARAASRRGVVVEAGFEARYKAVWETARTLIASGRLGRVLAVNAVALWDCDPASWYSNEALSGGMPLSHMTYCFLNPLRWMLGEPVVVAAAANRLVHGGDLHVREETCCALLRFPGDILASLTAGYVRSAEEGTWRVMLFGERASLDIAPGEDGPGRLRLLSGGEAEEFAFPPHEDGFRQQAEAFVEAVRGGRPGRNRPQDCLGDLQAVAAIRRAASSRRGPRSDARDIYR